jgi:hypothetical protein
MASSLSATRRARSARASSGSDAIRAASNALWASVAAFRVLILGSSLPSNPWPCALICRPWPVPRIARLCTAQRVPPTPYRDDWGRTMHGTGYDPRRPVEAGRRGARIATTGPERRPVRLCQAGISCGLSPLPLRDRARKYPGDRDRDCRREHRGGRPRMAACVPAGRSSCDERAGNSGRSSSAPTARSTRWPSSRSRATRPRNRPRNRSGQRRALHQDDRRASNARRPVEAGRLENSVRRDRRQSLTD